LVTYIFNGIILPTVILMVRVKVGLGLTALPNAPTTTGSKWLNDIT